MISGALAVASKQTTAKAPQRGGLSLSGGSPTGYRRAVREIPNRVIAMRESNAPSPPVSQFAAITSSRRNNLPLRARQTVGRTQHVVYPLLPVGFMGRSQPRPHDASWCQHAAPSAVDVSRAGRRYSIPSPVDNRQIPAPRRSVTITRAIRCTPGSSATQGNPGCCAAASDIGAYSSSPPHLELLTIKNHL